MKRESTLQDPAWKFIRYHSIFVRSTCKESSYFLIHFPPTHTYSIALLKLELRQSNIFFVNFFVQWDNLHLYKYISKCSNKFYYQQQNAFSIQWFKLSDNLKSIPIHSIMKMFLYQHWTMYECQNSSDIRNYKHFICFMRTYNCRNSSQGFLLLTKLK